jgi:hypothetical protein
LFKKLIFFFWAVFLFGLSNSDVIANFWMDECYWGKVVDKSGNGYDATAKNNASSYKDGIIFRDGNLTGNAYLQLDKYLPLTQNYSIKLWIKFPLGDKSDNPAYYNIADRDGSDEDFIYFKYSSSFFGGGWDWCLKDGNGEHCNSFTTPDDGWHMVTFVANYNDNKTYFYIDDNDPDSMDYYVGGELYILGNSDYDLDKRSINTFIDEYTVFNKDLNSDEVKEIYNNEKNGLNFDGSQRYNFTITPIEMEAGRVDIHNTFNDTTWTHVDFNKSFNTTPVIFSVATANGSDPASVRFKNITKDGFDIVITEPLNKDGKHVAQSVSYIAVNPGLHILDGHYIDVKTVSTKKYQVRPDDGNTGWSRITLDVPICNAAILANIQTLNNLIDSIPGNPLRPWTTAVLRKVDNFNIDVALEKSEVKVDSINNNETIAILATEGEVNGTFTDINDNNISYELRFIPKYFKGWSDSKLYKDFLNSYDSTPLVIGWKDSRYGNNGGWARLWDLTDSNVSFVTDEDKYKDSERNHIKEDYTFLAFSQSFHIAKTAIVNYRMDECKWDSDTDTYEIVNYGKKGAVYNATAGNDANVTNGKIYNGGDINSTDSNDKYILAENNIILPDNYSISFWAKFPLNTDGHKEFQEGSGGFFGSQTNVYYLNIADRPGSDNDFIYFKYDKDNDKWYVCVDDNCQEYDVSSLSNWHMITFTSDGSKTKFYVDKNETLSFDNVVNGELGLIFNSDYKADEDNKPNGQSIGTVVDEFKIFNFVLGSNDISTIYDNENSGLNWDGSFRKLGGEPVANWQMDACEWNNTTEDVKDSSENNLNGTSYNGLNTATGKICKAGEFDGEDDYIKIDNNSLLSVSKLTYMAWIKRKDPNVSKNSSKLEAIFINQDSNNGLYLVENSDSNNPNKVLFKLRIGGNTKELYSSTEIDDTDWHHIAATYDGNKMVIYIDGKEDANSSVSGNIDIGNKDNYIGSSGSDDYFYGKIDEVKVYNKALSSCDISVIYSYEDSGKNYDGSLRSCNSCGSNGPFDAWNVDHNITDRNITTKIVSKEFNLTIASLSEDGSEESNFSGVVCTRLISNDTNITDWNETKWDEESEKNITFLVNRAYKDVKVNIRWNKDDTLSCPLDEYNETNSSDNFAIRPLKFDMSSVSIVKAGSDFNVTFKALDNNLNPTKEYNESIHIRGNSVDLEYNDTNCKTGSLSGSLSDFSNGESNSTLSYSEVGEVNFTIQEIQGSEFAAVDSDDTPLEDRLISPKSTVIKFIPHHFKIDATLKNYSDFTYLDNELNIKATIDLNITAENENNQTTTNYNTNCYAKDIDINISKDIVPSDINVSNLIYYLVDAKGNESSFISQDKDDSINLTYKESNFTTDNNGSTNLKILFNFDRNYSKTSNPFVVENVDVNVSDEDINLDYKSINGSAKFFYGNLITNDILTTEDEFNTTFEFAMYDDNSSDNLIPSGAKEIGYNWWENLLSDLIDANVSDSNIVVSSDYNASNAISGIDVNVVEINDGKITFSIKRDDTDINFAVIHLLEPNLKWVWYSKDYSYDISNNSNCARHFCFAISWKNSNEDNSQSVGSGEFEGTEANITQKKVGVKIFR